VLRLVEPKLSKTSTFTGDVKRSPPPSPSVDLRNVMRYFASAVTVVTGALNSGELFGLTVSAFTSVSLNPPLVLICIRNESTAIDLFKRAQRYCVNILAEDQQSIAEKFSLQGEARRFENLDYYIGKVGSPIIRGCIGYIDCKLVESIVLGDHTVFIGQAVNLSAEKKLPLLYIDKNYVWLNQTK
jgi:3-hydroxy-9,10-secoandrosta-1,3,5(10)-triene-9,17-dione monooxygenase reductase component